MYRKSKKGILDGENDCDASAVMMHGSENGLTLRPDLRRALEAGEFTFVPGEGYWVAHFFDSTSPLGIEFDHKEVLLSNEVRREYLLVHFAAAIFPLIKEFVDQGDTGLTELE